jgi:nitrogen fixation protein NifQ
MLHARGRADVMAAAAVLPQAVPAPVPLALQRRSRRVDEVEDVASLLVAHADPDAGSAAQAMAMAEAIAVASLGDNHLWQDLGLGSRSELSGLIGRWFPALVAKNAFDMKWKKFLYRQLCEREQLPICRSPSCAVCSDHGLCFGPES